MALPEEIVQSISISNAKSIAEQPAVLSNLALANQIFNQNLTQSHQIAESNAMGVARLTAIKSLAEYDPIDVSQARASETLLTGDAVARQMQSLLAALNSGGQGVKSMAITPPVTGV